MVPALFFCREARSFLPRLQERCTGIYGGRFLNPDARPAFLIPVRPVCIHGTVEKSTAFPAGAGRSGYDNRLTEYYHKRAESVKMNLFLPVFTRRPPDSPGIIKKVLT